MIVGMRDLVEMLCSDDCAGRAPGTEGSRLARARIIEELRGARLDPSEQVVPGCRGANVLATIPGEIDRWILVAAHYDHLGTEGRRIYRGADDNAAAVAILIDVARGLSRSKPRGRGVIIAAFDAEEPPHFLSPSMGSEHFARQPIVPLDRIDLMVCMDLVGHRIGDEGLPSTVGATVFALGTERSDGTAQIADEISTPGVIVRRADAEIIPPLSDYAAFWDRSRPFVLLTNGRSRVYHTPEDTPEKLAWDKMAATARWLEAFVRSNCARSEAPFVFSRRRDDAATLDSFIALTSPLAELSVQAKMGLQMAKVLRGNVGANGSLPANRHPELAMLISAIESGLA
jgi:Zn-dependent M28 family amino/carboxypeptidase